jgi:hypothetical protein
MDKWVSGKAGEEWIWVDEWITVYVTILVTTAV